MQITYRWTLLLTLNLKLVSTFVLSRDNLLNHRTRLRESLKLGLGKKLSELNMRWSKFPFKYWDSHRTRAPAYYKIHKTSLDHDYFPVVHRIGGSYKWPDWESIISVHTSAENEDWVASTLGKPAHVNFHEIFTNSLSLLNDETLTSVGKDDDFHLNNLHSQLAEFHLNLHTTTTSTTTTSSTPPPRFPKKSYLLSTTTNSVDSSTEPATTTTSTTTTTRTTNTPRTPITRPGTTKQRGVLDLLFPAARVKNFKNVFDTVRRILSYTFKK